MNKHECRACRSQLGDLVLDLGKQPACDRFPEWDDEGEDLVYPLQMWLCASCGLGQLLADPTVPEEPRGAEPAALVAQAGDAVSRIAAAGLLRSGARVAEYGSPHGGSWLGLLEDRGLVPVADGQPADVIVDCFGMMHAADQSAALAERAARLAPGGVLLLQYHSLLTIVRDGQWNVLRHGHYAYYSTTALTGMLTAAGLRPRAAWQFDLYGGTVLLAAERAGRDERASAPARDVMALLSAEAVAGIRRPETVSALQREALSRARGLRDWLTGMRNAGQTVLGYSAASRAVALLCSAGVNSDLLPAIADASPAKQGLRMPGTNIPIISPAELTARRPAAVIVFVPDLLTEVRRTYPEIEASGGQWVDASLPVRAG
jgi:hypothetical protein